MYSRFMVFSRNPAAARERCSRMAGWSIWWRTLSASRITTRRSSGVWARGVKESLMFMGPLEGVDYTACVKAGKIAVFGVPTAAGARSVGIERGAFVLREIGLLRELKDAGARVVNLSDLSLFPFRDDPEHGRERNAEVVACAVRAAGDEMTRALAEGFTVVLGGDASLLPGVLAGAQSALGRPVGLAMLS